MQTSTSGTRDASNADVLHTDVDATDADAGQVLYLVFHGLDDGGGDGADGDAVFHDCLLYTSGNDVYVFEGPRGEVLVPALKSVVKKVDLEAGEMVLVAARLREVAVFDAD